MSAARERVQVGASAIVAAALIVALHLQIDWVRGPDYFRWPATPLPDVSLFVLLAPALLVGWAVWRGRADAGSALAFFTAAALQALALSSLRGEGPGLAHAADLLEAPTIHGYLSTARSVCPSSDWLATYPAIIADQGVHVRVHPPGPVASYCALFGVTGSGRDAAVVAALLLGSVAASTPAWVQALAGELGLGPRGALIAAALAALSPASSAFFPSFDAAYPAIVCALCLAWLRASGEGSRGWAVAAGVIGWALSACSYVLGVVAVPLAVVALVRGTDRRRVGLTVAIALATFIALYIFAWLVSGFDPIAVFRQALSNQASDVERWFPTRAWPRTIGWDLWDFALGLPATVVIPALMLAQRAVASRDRALITVAALGLVLPTVAASSGQITGETFRTWMFMAPAVHLAAATELERWRPSSSAIFLACTALLSASVVQQVAFVWGA